MLAITGSTIQGFNYLFMRKLVSLNEYVHPFYFSICLTIGNVLIDISSGSVIPEFSIMEYSLLLLCGLLQFVHLIGQSKALKLEKAGRVGAINYLSVAMIYLIDVIFMGTQVTWVEVLGSLLIISFTFINSIRLCFEKPHKDV